MNSPFNVSSHSLFKKTHSQRGTLMVLTVMVLAMLGLFALSMGYALRQRLQVVQRLDGRQKLQLIGEAGVKRAVNLVLPEDERIYRYHSKAQSWSHDPGHFKEIEIGDGRFSVFYSSDANQNLSVSGKGAKQFYGVIDEERKLNLNRVRSADSIKKLVQSAANLPEDAAKAITESIMDWLDNDDDMTAAGAEAAYYQRLVPSYRPRNDKLVMLEELLFIKGVDREIYDLISSHITLNSSGKININTAGKPVLLAAGLPDSVCNKILEFRRGRDKTDGTQDDSIFTDIASAKQLLANALYLDDNEASSFQALVDMELLTVKSKTFSVSVVASLKNRNEGLRIQAVFNENRGIVRWFEEFVLLA